MGGTNKGKRHRFTASMKREMQNKDHPQEESTLIQTLPPKCSIIRPPWAGSNVLNDSPVKSKLSKITDLTYLMEGTEPFTPEAKTTNAGILIRNKEGVLVFSNNDSEQADFFS